MACEVPVVATGSAAFPKVVEDGVTGLLVPIEPATTAPASPSTPPASPATSPSGSTRSIAPALSRRAFGQPGERAVESFGWPAIAERVVGVYRATLS
jgi:starch synthase